MIILNSYLGHLKGAGSFVLPQNFHVKTDQYLGLSTKKTLINYMFYIKADALERSNNPNMFCDIFTISRGGGRKTEMFNSNAYAMQRTYRLKYRCNKIDILYSYILQKTWARHNFTMMQVWKAEKRIRCFSGKWWRKLIEFIFSTVFPKTAEKNSI